MTALRTTFAAVSRHGCCTPCRLWLLLPAVAAVGCGTAAPAPPEPTPAASAVTATEGPNWITNRELPPPDADRIEYDAEKRTLTLYDLPGRNRWMVQLPDEDRGRPVGPRHRIPEGADKSRTLVYYVRSGNKPSTAITVAQIEAGRAAHTSVAFNP